MRKHDLICDGQKDYGDDQLASKGERSDLAWGGRDVSGSGRLMDLTDCRHARHCTVKDNLRQGDAWFGNDGQGQFLRYTAQAPISPAFQSFPVMAAIPVAESLCPSKLTVFDRDGKSICSAVAVWGSQTW